ncbi:MAG: phosphoribosylanthranilate isomerase [Gemmatimonadaceae bacterium]
MPVQLKFCGLTRTEDVAEAVRLEAEYAGVIFAGGPRERTMEQATSLFMRGVPARRVGVFARSNVEALRVAIAGVPLDVVQLHGDATGAGIAAARAAGASEVWAVVRVDGVELPAYAEELFQTADAVVLDTKGTSGLGGTGRVFSWEAIAAQVTRLDRRARLVVAGGLTSLNVARAIRALAPDVVDVSSGVESAPGVKDHSLMCRFAEAARSA